MKRILLVCANYPPRRCGVGDYTARLAGNLSSRKIDTAVLTGNFPKESHGAVEILANRSGWSVIRLWKILGLVKGYLPDVVIIQWVPYLYNRWGINFAVPLLALTLRLCGIATVVYFHETWVEFRHWKFFILGPFQRVAGIILLNSSRKAFVSNVLGFGQLRCYTLGPVDKIEIVPVPSNVQVYQASKAEISSARFAYGFSASTILIATFAAKSLEVLIPAMKSTFQMHERAALIMIGTESAEIDRLGFELDERIVCTGHVTETEVSLLLQGSDVFVALFEDGVSTKRGSCIAGIAHSLPIVSNIGRSTDKQLFTKSPIRFASYDKGGVSMQLLSLLALSAEERAEIGRQTGRYFENTFSWKSNVDKIVSGISALEQ